MRTLLAMFVACLAMVPGARADHHMIVKASPHSVAKTLDRLSAILEKKGITVFKRIDHAAGAKKVDIELRPTQVLIFGNPKLGSPLMTANQQIGLDLPLKALAWKDEAGKVWLGYTTPAELQGRYGVKGRDEVFKKMTGALNKLTDAALKAE